MSENKKYQKNVLSEQALNAIRGIEDLNQNDLHS